MYLETHRLVIREFQMEDAGDLQEILGDAETMKFSEPPYTPERTARFLSEFCIGKQGALAAVRRESGQVIGYLLFHALEEGLYEMGWFFNRRFWRQGYAFEACSALIEYAFRERRAYKIFAETIDGLRSVRFMEKLGMWLEGVQRGQTKDCAGNWTDVYLYGLLREDWAAE